MDTLTCPDCGVTLPPNAPPGQCPACLFRLGIAAAGGGVGSTLGCASSEKAGDRIGRYKLLEKIGEGGCGIVYMAEQEEPVRRRVALKVIKLGMDTKNVIARFEAERQALALMDHPNIARVLDAGATETGRPFFVMELVRGLKITDYCDQNQLSTTERLALFLHVCRAVQHAHQKGIIHRDLKPSNILVTVNDGVAVPKVIDFGIAKATEGRLTDKTLCTEFHQFIGTPAYMSPEQAEMTSVDIDTRSDIYSLGVLLYELLTGKIPFEAKRLLEAGLDEVRRIIREEEPVTPSTRLHTLDAAEQTMVARYRQSDPLKLVHLIRGDLDWIVMKALEKNRGHRYETANGLAMDIQRYLSSEPVVARPPSNLYRLQRLIKRNRLAFAAASAVAVTVMAGLGVSTWLFVKETQARQRATSAQVAYQTEQAFRKRVETALQETERARKAEEEQRKLKEMALAEAERARQAEVEARAKEANLRKIAEAALSHAEGQDYLRRITLADAELSADNVTEAERVLDECHQSLRNWEWYYLKRLCHEEILTLRGHTLGVRTVAFSPDGKRLASGSYGRVTFQPRGSRYERETLGEILVWDVSSGRGIATLSNEVFAINSLSFSPKGDRLAAGGSGGVRVWDLDSPAIEHPIGFSNEVSSVAFSPDGQYLASGHADGTTKLWESSSGLLVRTFTNICSVTGVAFSTDGRRLASACGQAAQVNARGNTIPEKPGEVVLWACATGERILTLNPRGSAALAVAFSPSGKLLASCHGNKTIIVWDVTTGYEVTKIRELKDLVYSVVFSPDSRRLLTGGADKTVRAWDVVTGQEEFVLRGHSKSVSSVALSQDGNLAASASEDKTVKIWAATINPGMQTIEPQTTNQSMISHLAFSSDGTRLAWAGGGVYVSDVKSGKTLRNLRPDGKTGFCKLQFSPDNGSLAVSAGDEVTIFSIENGEIIRNLTGFKEAYGVAFSPDGKLLAAGDGKLGELGDVKICDIASGRFVETLKGHVDSVWDVAFSPNGKLLASASGTISADNPFLLYGGKPGEVKIWDLGTQKEIRTLLGHKFCVWAVAFSPDGARLATASGAYSGEEPGEVRVWDVTTGQELFTLTAQAGCVFSVAFSPDGKRIITSDGSFGSRRPSAVQLWDAETGAKILSLGGHRAAVYGVSFSPDGTRIAAVGGDGTVRIWLSERQRTN